MREQRASGDTWYAFDSLVNQPGLVHAFASRPCNYAPHRGPGADGAIAARRAVCAQLGVSFDRLTSPSQVHGAEVVAVNEDDAGRGAEGRDSAVRFVDGLMTDVPGLPLILMSADCPLILVYDPQRPAIGAVHASWQGTVARAAQNLVRQMVRVYGSDPAGLQAGIAPSGGPCCYEVGREVRRIAEGRLTNVEGCFVCRDDRLYFDLWAANRDQLIESGVLAAHIEVARLCSICDERFWSHRRQAVQAGRSALFAALKG